MNKGEMAFSGLSSVDYCSDILRLGHAFVLKTRTDPHSANP